MANNILLKIDNLHARIGDREILKGVSLEIKRGEIHAVMGPNGAGKSTLSSVLTGKPAYEVTEGSVLFDGRDLLAMKPEDAMALVTPRRKTAPMRYAVTELLCGLGSAGTKELCYFTGASMQTLRSLAKSGVITLEEQEVFRRVLPPEGELRRLMQFLTRFAR